jgi:hypothetical protein
VREIERMRERKRDESESENENERGTEGWYECECVRERKR